MSTVGIIGEGVVGTALKRHLSSTSSVQLRVFDKYKESHETLENVILNSRILFLCLPTPALEIEDKYDISEISWVLERLEKDHFQGPVILQSTVLPGTTQSLQRVYHSLFLLHLPEFLSCRTADHDIGAKPTPIYLGASATCPVAIRNEVYAFLQSTFPSRDIWTMRCTETESTKFFCNAFYAAKLSMFQEFYKICSDHSQDCSFEIVRQAMLQQKWIHPSHTYVPGTESNFTIGGTCLPKDFRVFLAKYGNPF